MHKNKILGTIGPFATDNFLPKFTIVFVTSSPCLRLDEAKLHHLHWAQSRFITSLRDLITEELSFHRSSEDKGTSSFHHHHRQQLTYAKSEALNTALLHQTPKKEAQDPRNILAEPRIETWAKRLKNFFITSSLTKFRRWIKLQISVIIISLRSKSLSPVSESLHHFITWLRHWWSAISSRHHRLKTSSPHNLTSSLMKWSFFFIRMKWRSDENEVNWWMHNTG